jgi:hypothetical protein
MVTPENAKKLAIGWGSEKVERQDMMVAGNVTVMDGPAIDEINRGTLREISMGYRCRIDQTSGVHPEFGRYDQIQRQIRYNHIALGGVDWGRAGKEVGLRLDGAVQRQDAFTGLEHLVMDRADLLGMDRIDLAKKAGIDLWELEEVLYGFGVPKRATLEKIAKAIEVHPEVIFAQVPRMDRADQQRTDTMDMTITIGGVEFTVPKAAGQAMQNVLARNDETQAKLKTENEKLQGRADALDEELKSTKEKLQEAEDPKRLDSAVTERLDLIAQARKVLGTDTEIKGTKRQIQEMVLKHDCKDLDLADRNDDYVAARFEQKMDTHQERVDDKHTARSDARNARESGGGGGRRTADQARLDMIERNKNEWKTDKDA